MAIPQDQTLIIAAQHGDREAIQRLLVSCQFDMRRMARTECANPEDADDAVQETMVQVYRRIGTLRALASYSGWIYSIVRHECQRLVRHMRRRAELPDEDAPIFARQSNYSLSIDLAAAIESLPHKYREAIILRDCEERSITEIAQSLDLTREAVKSRIHRARQMTREYLKD